MEEEKKTDTWSMEPETRAEKCCQCPLGQIPAEVWRRLLRPPFRKRHPLWFWLGILILILAVGSLPGLFFSDDEYGGSGQDCVALVAIEGPIMDAGPTLAWIRKVENNPEVKGIFLRINSPGGGAAASQEIYSALARVGKKIPVVASMGATAASGGLMIAMAAERIFANPSTITGSIGVRMDIPQLEGLMSKIGIGQETLVTGSFKDAASWARPLSPEDRAYLQGVLMNMHEQFVGIVANGRHMEKDKAAALANGKIFTGEEALKLGLVDALGGEYEAMAWIADKAGVPQNRKLLKRKPNTKTRLLDSILGAMGMLLARDALEDLEKAKTAWTQPAFLYQAF